MNRFTRRRKLTITILVFLVVISVPVIVAQYAVVGFVVTVWRFDAIRSLVGPDSDRSHAAFWVFKALYFIALFLAILAGCMVYLPLMRLFPWLDWSESVNPSTPGTEFWGPWPRGAVLRLLKSERRCAVLWSRRVRANIRQVEVGEKPDSIESDLD